MALSIGEQLGVLVCQAVMLTTTLPYIPSVHCTHVSLCARVNVLGV